MDILIFRYFEHASSLSLSHLILAFSVYRSCLWAALRQPMVRVRRELEMSWQKWRSSGYLLPVTPVPPGLHFSSCCSQCCPSCWPCSSRYPNGTDTHKWSRIWTCVVFVVDISKQGNWNNLTKRVGATSLLIHRWLCFKKTHRYNLYIIISRLPCYRPFVFRDKNV